MTSNAFWPFGTVLQAGDGAATEVFTTLAEMTAIVPPQLSRDAIDVTSMQSSGGWKEFIPGLRDGGVVTLALNWLPTDATHNSTTGLLESFNDDFVHNWKIVLPDGLATITFAGFLTAFNTTLPMTEESELSISIKVSGIVTVSV
jgi:predicted secreted protein